MISPENDLNNLVNENFLNLSDINLINARYIIPNVDIIFFENNSFVKKNIIELFKDKRVLLVSSVGAFTHISSNYQLPDFEKHYEEIISYGIDEIYCVSVDKPIVLKHWSESIGIEKIKFIPDPNGYITGSLGMTNSLPDNGVPLCSWKYCAIVNNNTIEWILEEENKCYNNYNDLYLYTTPSTVIEYLKK